ncbi:MAG: ribokinase [Ruminococcaceae bacterium]|nr:ribokinase [Oscillospiraceae bacterium]
MESKIIVIGSANADYVIHTDKMPLLGETLVGHSFQVNAGGKGLNQAIAVAKLGGDVSFIGCVGNDSGGDMLLDELEKNGVVFDGVKADGVSTGSAVIVVVNGDNFIIINPGANEVLTPEVIDGYSDTIAESDYCIMQLEIPMESVMRVCEIAKQSGTKIVLNPAPYKEMPKELYSYVDYLIPNEYEAKDITGIYPDTEENCREAVSKLMQMGVNNVIITLGERGCVYNKGEDVVFCPAVKATAVDTTSAGDTFVGAVVSKLSHGESLDCAISYAAKASAITVSREGASKSIPWANEIE